MPSANELIFDRLLTNVVYEKGMGVTGIAGSLAPRVKSTTLTGSFMKKDRNKTAARVKTERAPGGSVKRQERPGRKMETFRCTDHALEEDIPIEIIEGASESEVLSERTDSAMRVLWNILNEWEEDVHNKVWRDAKADLQTLYGADQVIDPTAKWDSSSGVNIKRDILTIKNTVYEACGYVPNRMLLPNNVFNIITTMDNELRDATKYVQGGPVTLQILSSYFEIGQVLVPMYLKDDETKGEEGKSMLWQGDNIGLFYVDTSGSKKKDTLLSTFYWESATQKFLGVSRGWDSKHKSEIVQVSGYYTVEEIDMACGGFIADVLS